VKKHISLALLIQAILAEARYEQSGKKIIIKFFKNDTQKLNSLYYKELCEFLTVKKCQGGFI
jgi:hypothetical protein